MAPLDKTRIQSDYRRARALQDAGQLKQAAEAYQALLKTAPRLAEAHYQLGRIALAIGDPRGALAPLARARALRPTETEILRAQARAQAEAGEPEAAAATWGEAIALRPNDIPARAGRALVLQRLGRFAEAEADLRAGLAVDPTDGELYRMLVATRRLTPDDPLIAEMEAALATPGLPERKRVHLNFALARAMEQTGRPDRVFAYLRPANEALRRAHPWNPADRAREVDALIAAFDGHDFPAPAPDDGLAPIFVTGLPRSGSTLVERILAAHSDVTAGGEMPYALRLGWSLLGDPARGLRRAAELPAKEVASLGRHYRHAVRRRLGTTPAPRVTDKGMQSYLMIGLLRQALPGARFLVVRRDPRDQLFSIYRQLFAEGTHRYANDLDDLADYYAQFLRILAFWHEALPGVIHEVSYEALVADPESGSRALLAAAGLDWQDGVRDFHARPGEVRTLSVGQVRRPIHTEATGAWRAHESDLAPLIEGLERRGCL